MGTVSDAKQAAGQVSRHVRPWVITLARLGFAVKGIVYIILGILAFQAAQGASSAKINQKDVLLKIITQPFGRILLIVVAVGLFGYALWRLIQAVLDPEHIGSKGKQILQRIGYFVSAVVYGSLAFTAYKLISGKGSSGSTSPQDVTAKLMTSSLGTMLVGLVGVIIIGVGLYSFYQAYSKKFQQQYPMSNLRPEQRRMAVTAGRLGTAARGVVNLIIGGFLVQAALTHNPAKAGGLGEAFQTLAAQPYGTVLLAIVAIGLLCYGIYMLVFARYGRIANSVA